MSKLRTTKLATPRVPAKVAPSYICKPLRVLDVLFHLQYRSKTGIVFEGEMVFSKLPSGCDRRKYYFTFAALFSTVANSGEVEAVVDCLVYLGFLTVRNSKHEIVQKKNGEVVYGLSKRTIGRLNESLRPFRF